MFVIHRLCAFALLALSLVSLRAQTITVAPDRASALYQAGEAIRWQVTVTEAATLLNPSFTIKSGGVTTVQSGSLVLANGKATLEAKLDQPGWLLLEVTGKNATGTTLQAFGGAVVSPEQITPSSIRPADFDSFWDEKLRALKAVPINPVLTPGSSGRTGVDYSTITLDCIGGSKVQGQLARPSTGDKLPALLIVQWAGVYSLQKSWATDRAAEGWLVLNTQAHDIAPVESDAYFQALNSGSLNNYPHIGNEDRETSYFLRMYLACHRAAEYLTTRPDWDGRTLVVMGASQGGLQALITAALHPAVTAAIAEVPAGSDQGGLDVGRLPGWPVWAWQAWDRNATKVMQTSRYYDVTHFAPRIHCPVLIGVGLIDTVVPPPGVYATYNLLRGAKQIVPMPLADHSNNHTPFYTPQNNWLSDARTKLQPTISEHPAPVTAQLGGSAFFSAGASSGQAFGYQWLKNGVAIAGATQSTLDLSAVTNADAGNYSVIVTSPGGTVTSNSALLNVDPVPHTRLLNLSARCFIGTDSSIGIAGIVLEYESTVLIRGVGPSLATYGVTGVLQKPVLKLFNSDKILIAQNTGWKNNTEQAIARLNSAMSQTQAFTFSSDDDSALVVTLPAGLYTAQVNGLNATTGNGMIEVYLVK